VTANQIVAAYNFSLLLRRHRSHSIYRVVTTKRLQHILMSGADAQKPENLIKFFEAIKGRKATAQEVSRFKRKRKRPVAKDAKP